ncbi:hypothetical protein CASFOL_005676 [Castilleja foliolosa]|uniref:Gnk2-homologous domain-containing protein n=1 Tax=Castilleja foliolosa TaxID=1961234 RepID=A0ABD3E452_9LAMI
MNNNLDPHNSLLLLVLVLFLVSNSIIPSQCEEPAYYLCGAVNATSQNSKTIHNLLPKLVKSTNISGSTTITSNKKNRDPIYVRSGPVQRRPRVLELHSQCNKSHSPRQILSHPIRCPDVTTGQIYINTANVTNPEDYNGNLTQLMDKLTLEAVGSENGMGKGTRVLSNVDSTLYALLQCNKDILDRDYARCGDCLYMARNNLNATGPCYNHKGCLVLYSSCYLRVEFYPFFYNFTSVGSSGDYEERVVTTDVIKT